MKKQSGFTLIELMVVMAIIAILATAGLSAYTGYIKKARDTTRIADLGALNTIVLGQLGATGTPITTAALVDDAATLANNSKRVADPQETKLLCLDSTGSTTLVECVYTYRLCDTSLGFAIGARFESSANLGMYVSDEMNATGGTMTDGMMFEVGSCKAYSSEPVRINTGGAGTAIAD